MAVNSSSFNDAFHPDLFLGLYCLITRPSSLILAAFSISNILLLLPLCILVLYLGLQRWHQQRSTSTMMSHSDCFTYHMAAMELIGFFGITFYCSGIYRDNVNIFYVGYFVTSFTWYGETFFHILTCAERYLAVVHPVIYLSLRRERGIRIRNISIGCVWLLCFGGISVMISNAFIIVDVCFLMFSLIVISFCSLSVLCVLIRPGPGDQGGDRDRVHQSKLRAFYTIVAILAVLLLRCCGNLVWLVLYENNSDCVLTISTVWFNVPSTLVLPVLFLYRAGTLACCKNTK